MVYTEINSKAIDKWVESGWEWSIPITHEVFENAKSGKWDVVLTPIKSVPHEWFSPYIKNERLDSVNLLGLASGGGKQMPSFLHLARIARFLRIGKTIKLISLRPI